MTTHTRFVLNACCTISLLVGLLGSGLIAHAADNSGAAIAQGFKVDGTASDFVAGALVSVKDGQPDTVQLAGAASASRLIGVIGKNPLLSLSGGKNQVQVIISGTASILISDINGLVHTGDKITASPIDGVGMLASASTQVIGT